jgi:hypothetical protein
VPVASKVSVTFSKPMNASATEPAFSISPPVTGMFSWPTPERLEFAPAAPLAHGTLYGVSVSTAAKDTDGLHLQTAHAFSFTTEPAPARPAVVSTAPQDGATNVPRATTIEVNFTKEMDGASVQSSFSIFPPTPASFGGSLKSFVWTPAQPLTGSTAHTVTIAGGVKDLQGLSMGSDFKFTFTTEPAPVPPKVVAVTPTDGTTDWPGAKGVAVEFSAPMDRPSTEAAFRLDPSVAGAVDWDQTGTKLTFTPSAALHPGAGYTVKVSASARNSAGTEMGSDFTSGFEAGIPPKVVTTAPAEGAAEVPTSAVVTISFDERMDQLSVATALVTEPGFGYEASWNEAGDAVTLQPLEPLDPGLAHKVTVGPSASDRAGNQMGDEFHLTFTTAKERGATGIGGIPQIALLMLVLLAAVVAAVIALVALRRRRRKTPAVPGAAEGRVNGVPNKPQVR